MGEEHLQQLFSDAIARDCEAVSIALNLTMGISDVELKLFGCGYWDVYTTDKWFDVARKIAAMQHDFSGELKQMLLDGEIVVLGHVSADNEVIHITDTSVIDYDDYVCPEIVFAKMLSDMP